MEIGQTGLDKVAIRTRVRFFSWFAAMALLHISCHQTSTQQFRLSEEFKQYWYQGKAEVCVYDLSQSRYGEQRSGKAVLIFVTEDFSKSKQVKLDGETKGRDKVSVLKLNYTKNFVTGIYPYSMMTSVFTPVERQSFPHTLKATMSVQEWCGHVFVQLNADGNKYKVQSFSYFGRDGDEKDQIAQVLLEDELFNLIRIQPDQIPLGKLDVIPSLFYVRLHHLPLTPRRADVTVTKTGSEGGLSIVYEDGSREVQIVYSLKFPHQILSWEEKIRRNEEVEVNKAVLSKAVWTDYWRKNGNGDLVFRDSLGLSRSNY